MKKDEEAKLIDALVNRAEKFTEGKSHEEAHGFYADLSSRFELLALAAQEEADNDE